MNKPTRTLFNFLLGTIACVLLIGLSAAPSWSKAAASLPVSTGAAPAFSIAPTAEATPSQNPINQHLMADLQEAESKLMAQSMPSSSFQRYAAILMNTNIVPKAPETLATGVVGAVLSGDRLILRGDFGGLSSPLRDYTTDPATPPNPKITSGSHIHRGEANQNGPFQYALTVMMNETGMGGRLAGEYTLTAEQLQALADGKLYIDLHTRQHRAGELRGILRSL